MIYPNNLKSWEFDKEAPQNFRPDLVTIAERQGTSEDGNSEAKPTRSKTNISSCLGIYKDLYRTHLGFVNFGDKVFRSGLAVESVADLNESQQARTASQNEKSVEKNSQNLSGCGISTM